jgi:restriction endonuclease S subunit
MQDKNYFTNEWKTLPLKDLAKLGKRSGVPAKEIQLLAGVCRVTNHHLSKDPYILSLKNSEENPVNEQDKVYQAGTILVSLYRLHRGIGLLGMEATAEPGICGIKITSEKLIPEYLFHYLCWLRSYRSNNKWWKISDISNLIIPLPPLNVQQHIVTVLSKTSELIKKNREAIMLIDKYIMALYLSESVDQDSKEEVTYDEGTLKNFALEIDIGVPFRSNEFTSSYPILKKKSDLSLLEPFEKEKIKDAENREAIRNVPLAQPGDVLWNMKKNNVAIEEPAAIVNTRRFSIAYTNDWVRIRPLPHISSEYIAAFLSFEYPQINSISRSRRLNQLLEHLYTLPVRIPTELNHRLFTTMVRKANNISEKHQRYLDHLILLHESLSSELFS